MDFESRLERLLAIINLQAKLGWEERFRDDKRNIFHYFRSLGILSAEELDGVYSTRAPLRPNHAMRAYWKHIDYHFPHRYYAGRAAVDVGAGWGALTFWLLTSGARTVYAIGDFERTAFLRRLVDEARRAGLLDRAAQLIPCTHFVREGEERFGEDIPDEQASLVLFNDVLEHITPRTLPFVLRSSHRALRPGGTLVSVSLNGACQGYRSRMRPHWEDWERRHGIPQRLALVERELAGSAPGQAAKLAQSTRGLDSIAFNEALERFRASGAIPAGWEDTAPVDIAIDVVEEGIVVPAAVTKLMAEVGFQAVAYPAMMLSRRSRPLQPLARRFPGIFWRLGLFDDCVAFVGMKPAAEGSGGRAEAP